MPLLPVVAFLVVWAAGAQLKGSVLLLPGPGESGQALWELVRNGTIWNHVLASLVRVYLGFGLATLVGIPMGMLLGRIRWLESVADPLLQLFRPISPLAWVPLAILWFGIGDISAVMIIFLACVFPTIVHACGATRAVDPKLIKLAHNCGAGPLQLIAHVLLPAALPQMLTGLRLTFGLAWMVVVAAEMVAVQSGLGYLIIDARNALRTDVVIGVMLLIGTLGVMLNSGLCSVERWVHQRHGLS